MIWKQKFQDGNPLGVHRRYFEKSLTMIDSRLSLTTLAVFFSTKYQLNRLHLSNAARIQDHFTSMNAKGAKYSEYLR